MKILLGLAAGYLLGIMIAPMPGAELRQKLLNRADEAARQEAGHIGERVGEATYEGIKQAI
jgi:gas vesicle protein